MCQPRGLKVKTSTPVGVTPTVCSNCADSERSRVTAVQPSESIFTCGLAEIDHGLDGENHPRREHGAFSWRAVMQDIRLVVENEADAMAAEIAHDAAAFAFRKSLDRMADVAHGGAGPDDGNAAHHRFMRYLDKALGPARDAAHAIHAA